MARILIIDDSLVMRNLLTDFLTELGHEVDVSADGPEGLQMALSNDYDVCICDMHMPKMHGYDVMKEITPQKPELRLIFTDSLPDSLSEKVHRTGRHHLLRKPFELNQLRETLDAILKPVRKT
ncbi:MAG TPA: response regulator [Acidobacteriota bacterium]|nr:response regulator [Acidobacteriota bacterium]